METWALPVVSILTFVQSPGEREYLVNWLGRLGADTLMRTQIFFVL